MIHRHEQHERSPRKAVFLDRDGTLNEDPGYLNRPEQMKLLPQVGQALSELKKAGFLLVVVSNQSGVGRGIIDPLMLPRIHSQLDLLLSPWDVKIDAYHLCFHHPDEQCACRKPKPKLILDAALELGVEVAHSYMIGDRRSDFEAGIAACCKASILVRTGDGQKTESELGKPGELISGRVARPNFIADSLFQAVRWILGREKPGS